MWPILLTEFEMMKTDDKVSGVPVSQNKVKHLKLFGWLVEVEISVVFISSVNKHFLLLFYVRAPFC